MTTSKTALTTLPPPRGGRERRSVAAPGVRFYLVTLGAILLALDANSTSQIGAVTK